MQPALPEDLLTKVLWLVAGHGIGPTSSPSRDWVSCGAAWHGLSQVHRTWHWRRFVVHVRFGDGEAQRDFLARQMLLRWRGYERLRCVEVGGVRLPHTLAFVCPPGLQTFSGRSLWPTRITQLGTALHRLELQEYWGSGAELQALVGVHVLTLQLGCCHACGVVDLSGSALQSLVLWCAPALRALRLPASLRKLGAHFCGQLDELVFASDDADETELDVSLSNCPLVRAEWPARCVAVALQLSRSITMPVDCERLRRLCVRWSAEWHGGWHELEALVVLATRLQHLALIRVASGPGPGPDVAFLAHMRHLESLELRGLTCLGEEAWLPQLRRLRHLVLCHCGGEATDAPESVARFLARFPSRLGDDGLQVRTVDALTLRTIRVAPTLLAGVLRLVAKA